MRASIRLDAHAYAFASAYAGAKGISVGAAISELLRRAEQAPELSPAALTRSRRGLLVKAKTDRAVTPEVVKRLSEDDLD